MKRMVFWNIRAVCVCVRACPRNLLKLDDFNETVGKSMLMDDTEMLCHKQTCESKPLLHRIAQTRQKSQTHTHTSNAIRTDDPGDRARTVAGGYCDLTSQ
jgi:hypothetical protein